MAEIVFLSPYAKLTHMAHRLLKERGVTFEVVEVPPLQAEEFVKKVNPKAQVIISRGGTAALAKHYTMAPVVEIPVALSDIYDAIGKIQKNGKHKKIVIISTANIIYDPKFISEIQGLKIDFTTSADCFITSQDWIEERIQSETLAKDGGYDVIIGDAMVCTVAAKHGIDSVLLESNEESLTSAINEAMRVVEANRHTSQMLLKRRKELQENGWIAHYCFRDILGRESSLAQAIRQASLYAKSDGNILIEGETGTGKELFAQSIHNESDRVYGPFVSVNCSAISDSLFESELFGYDSGAFTGANRGGKKGLFECAQNGTIFLDEISETSINMQAKLLRVLQERKIRRVGSEKQIDLNARVICATNKNLLELADAGQFRRDLYYRLSELELFLPPLADRRDDILVIAESFLLRESGKINRKVFWKDRSVFAPLTKYDWPGNVRELRNFIIKLAASSPDGELTCDDVEAVFRSSYRESSRKHREAAQVSSVDTPGELTVRISNDLRVMEREILTKLLALHGGDKEWLCREYGISKPTLWRKMNYKKES